MVTNFITILLRITRTTIHTVPYGSAMRSPLSMPSSMLLSLVCWKASLMTRRCVLYQYTGLPRTILAIT